jgi:hypothetical protein
MKSTVLTAIVIAALATALTQGVGTSHIAEI